MYFSCCLFAVAMSIVHATTRNVKNLFRLHRLMSDPFTTSHQGLLLRVCDTIFSGISGMPVRRIHRSGVGTEAEPPPPISVETTSTFVSLSSPTRHRGLSSGSLCSEDNDDGESSVDDGEFDEPLPCQVVHVLESPRSQQRSTSAAAAFRAASPASQTSHPTPSGVGSFLHSVPGNSGGGPQPHSSSPSLHPLQLVPQTLSGSEGGASTSTGAVSVSSVTSLRLVAQQSSHNSTTCGVTSSTATHPSIAACVRHDVPHTTTMQHQHKSTTVDAAAVPLHSHKKQDTPSDPPPQRDTLGHGAPNPRRHQMVAASSTPKSTVPPRSPHSRHRNGERTATSASGTGSAFLSGAAPPSSAGGRSSTPRSPATSVRSPRVSIHGNAPSSLHGAGPTNTKYSGAIGDSPDLPSMGSLVSGNFGGAGYDVTPYLMGCNSNGTTNLHATPPVAAAVLSPCAAAAGRTPRHHGHEKAIERRLSLLSMREHQLHISEERMREAAERREALAHEPKMNRVRLWLAISSLARTLEAFRRTTLMARFRRKAAEAAIPMLALRLRRYLRRTRAKMAAKSGAKKPAIASLRFDKMLNLFSDEHLQFLIDNLQLRYYFENETIIFMGSEDDEGYVLHQGTADVMMGSVKVFTMKAGMSFGTVGMISGEPRTASIVAREPCLVWYITRGKFESYGARDDKVEAAQELIAELRQANIGNVYKGILDAVYLENRFPLFKGVSIESIRTLMKFAKPRICQKGRPLLHHAPLVCNAPPTDSAADHQHQQQPFVQDSLPSESRKSLTRSHWSSSDFGLSQTNQRVVHSHINHNGLTLNGAVKAGLHPGHQFCFYLLRGRIRLFFQYQQATSASEVKSLSELVSYLVTLPTSTFRDRQQQKMGSASEPPGTAQHAGKAKSQTRGADGHARKLAAAEVAKGVVVHGEFRIFPIPNPAPSSAAPADDAFGTPIVDAPLQAATSLALDIALDPLVDSFRSAGLTLPAAGSPQFPFTHYVDVHGPALVNFASLLSTDVFPAFHVASLSTCDGLHLRKDVFGEELDLLDLDVMRRFSNNVHAAFFPVLTAPVLQRVLSTLLAGDAVAFLASKLSARVVAEHVRQRRESPAKQDFLYFDEAHEWEAAIVVRGELEGLPAAANSRRPFLWPDLASVYFGNRAARIRARTALEVIRVARKDIIAAFLTMFDEDCKTLAETLAADYIRHFGRTPEFAPIEEVEHATIAHHEGGGARRGLRSGGVGFDSGSPGMNSHAIANQHRDQLRKIRSMRIVTNRMASQHDAGASAEADAGKNLLLMNAALERGSHHVAEPSPPRQPQVGPGGAIESGSPSRVSKISFADVPMVEEESPNTFTATPARSTGISTVSDGKKSSSGTAPRSGAVQQQPASSSQSSQQQQQRSLVPQIVYASDIFAIHGSSPSSTNASASGTSGKNGERVSRHQRPSIQHVSKSPPSHPLPQYPPRGGATVKHPKDDSTSSYSTREASIDDSIPGGPTVQSIWSSAALEQDSRKGSRSTAHDAGPLMPSHRTSMIGATHHTKQRGSYVPRSPSDSTAGSRSSSLATSSSHHRVSVLLGASDAVNGRRNQPNRTHGGEGANRRDSKARRRSSGFLSIHAFDEEASSNSGDPENSGRITTLLSALQEAGSDVLDGDWHGPGTSRSSLRTSVSSSSTSTIRDRPTSTYRTSRPAERVAASARPSRQHAPVPVASRNHVVPDSTSARRPTASHQPQVFRGVQAGGSLSASPPAGSRPKKPNLRPALGALQ